MKNNNLTRNFAQGFSLIELSIVLLIIGLIVVGVMGGQKLTTLSRLMSARALTSSSPVAGIENLALWVETTSKNSFIQTEAVNGSLISNWYDINPQVTDKLNFVPSINPANPATYSNNAANGLPALIYSGSAMQNSNLSIDRITSPTGDNTVFVVAKDNGTNSQHGFVYFWDGGANRLGFDFTYPTIFWNSGVCCGGRLSGSYTPYQGKWIIATGITSSVNGANFRINGTSINSGSPSTLIASGTIATMFIGRGANGGTFLDGGVAEVIVFSRALSSIEIGYIENYLSKKWKISLS